jgi:NAD(P)-dependent dehydrogenase (short-subunit alcohol dehydrogenase family)
MKPVYLARPLHLLYTHTNQYDHADLDAGRQQQIPLGRYGTPEEVADAVVFLAKNRYASNCMLNLDGGLSAT